MTTNGNLVPSDCTVEWHFRAMALLLAIDRRDRDCRSRRSRLLGYNSAVAVFDVSTWKVEYLRGARRVIGSSHYNRGITIETRRCENRKVARFSRDLARQLRAIDPRRVAERFCVRADWSLRIFSVHRTRSLREVSVSRHDFAYRVASATIISDSDSIELTENVRARARAPAGLAR